MTQADDQLASEGQQRPSAARRRGLGASIISLTLPLGIVLHRLPVPVLLPTLVVLLAGLDLVAGVLGKSWVATHSPWTMAAGAAIYAALFWLYAVSLRYGTLSTVTVAWVVLITVGDLALDRFYYGVRLSGWKWGAVVGALLLLVVLLAPEAAEQ